MTWFDSIYDLQYYHQPKGVPCYCEAVAIPSDMYLQGQLYDTSQDYTLKIYVYSADGLTLYEDATAYFDYYIGRVLATGRRLFNARLKSFSPAMCAHECYILRAEVKGITNGAITTVFNKYTERYCQNNCCDVPRNIIIDQTGFSPNIISGDMNDPSANYDMAPATSDDVAAFTPQGTCGEPLIRIISKFDCDDNFANEFYGTPEISYGGTSPTFEYRKVSTFRGRIVRRPRDIERTISNNCRLVQTESKQVFLLEGFELFPAWKMFELENQLHAKYIYIDDNKTITEYKYAGGTPFAQSSKCFELFKLSTTMELCTQRQIYGCEPNCYKKTNPDGSNVVFAIPANYQGGDFYDDNYQLIAHNVQGLKDYLRNQDGISDLQVVDTSSISCTPHVALSVTTTTNASVTGSIYYDSAIPNNKVQGITVNSWSELCDVLPVYSCVQPVVSTFTTTEALCAVPVASAFTNEETVTYIAAINGHDNWIADEQETTAAIDNKQVTFSLYVTNSFYAEDPSAPAEPIEVSEIIGFVGADARPQTIVALTSVNNALPDDTTITIDSSGRITYTGLTTTASASNVTIELNNLVYNI